MKINTFQQPASLEEALTALQAPGASLIGSGSWLKLTPVTLDLAIDLSLLNLNTISTTPTTITIGSQTPLRTLENHEAIKTLCGGLLSVAISQVMGVTLRHVVTLGGTIAGRYGFSDVLTPLLALDAKVTYYDQEGLSTISLETYLKSPPKKALVTEVVLERQAGNGYFACFKKTHLDFSVLNLALVRNDHGMRLVVGARPGRAMVAYNTSKALSDTKEEALDLEVLKQMLTEEIPLGENLRGSKTYRTKLLHSLLIEALKEVGYGNLA